MNAPWRWTFVIVAALLIPSAALLPQGGGEEEEEEEGDAMIDLDSLTGKERVDTILKLCASKDSEDAAALVTVLAEPAETDTEEILRKVFEALLRMRNPEIQEELERVLNSQDPVIQGYGIRIYARTFGRAAADRLLGLLSTVQGTARADWIVAVRDCPGPKVVSALRTLAERGLGEGEEEANLQLYVSLLRLGDATYGAQVFEAYAAACEAIRSLTEGLKYPDDPRKAKRDQVRIEQLIAMKGQVREDLAHIPPETLAGFAAGGALSRHSDVWSLLARLLPRLVREDTLLHFRPLLRSPSIEVTTLVLEAMARSKSPLAAEALRPEIDRLAQSVHPELRKAAVRHAGVLAPEAAAALAQRLLQDPDKWVRVECIEKLAEWRVASATGLLRPILKSTSDPDIQWSAEYALGLLGVQ